MSVRIGIDARAAAEVPAGRGRFVRELVGALARRDDPYEYVLYARKRWLEGALDSRFRWRLLGAPDPFWNVQAGLTAHPESDVFFSVNSYLTAWFTRLPTALNVFDMIAWQVPESAQARAARIERATIRPALQRAGRVVCNSQSTLADLVTRFPAVEPKCSVVPLAAADCFAHEPPEHELASARERYGLERPFVLSSGTLEPRKNLTRLIEAFAMLPEELRRDHTLVLAGPQGWEAEEILRRASALAGSVRVLGHVSDADLNCLYRLCTVFCYPSLYEGFGLPVLEAMRAGSAVLTSGVSSLPEVGGDGARYVDPTRVEQIRDALAALLSSADERSRLRERACRQAARFSWDRTAAGIVSQLAELARSRS
jgi:glycosyltransferase involved in cell wall biosynthesis